MSKGSKFLVIRRDNIGDLICTTPLIRRLRVNYPDARIDVLVNSYNRPVVMNNPDIDHVYAYTKAKHREKHETFIGVHLARLKMLWGMRRIGYDYAILANGGCLPRPLALASSIRPKQIIGFTEEGNPLARHIDLGVSNQRPRPMHEVENLQRLLGALQIHDEPMPAAIYPEAQLAGRIQAQVKQTLGEGGPLLAIHISSRKPPQRWPASHFIELMKQLHEKYQARFLLFWSPGDELNPHHPGDDRKATEIMDAVKGLPVLAMPTERLEELIAGISVCEQMICSDGGAMHVGAGLGKPIVCFFGNSDATVWRPWGVPYELLQKESRNVKDISVKEAVDAYSRLTGRAEDSSVQ